MATKRAVIALLLVAAGGCALTAEQLETLTGMRGQEDQTPDVQITIIINDEQVEVEQDE